MRYALAFFLLVAIAAQPSRADTFAESFDGGSNTGGWTFHGPNESVPSSGGNPGAYFRTDDLDTYAPWARTSQFSIFTGNYRANGVLSIGCDLATFYVDFSAEGRPLTIMLVSDNDTPANPNDDWAAYLIGEENVPLVGEGWRSYDFSVPSQAVSLPPGWSTIAFGPGSPADPDWNLLITDVRSLGFFYGDPEMVFIFQMWDLGLDNPRVIYGETTSAPEPGPAVASWGRIKMLFR